jgi:hypothetical protein
MFLLVLINRTWYKITLNWVSLRHKLALSSEKIQRVPILPCVFNFPQKFSLLRISDGKSSRCLRGTNQQQSQVRESFLYLMEPQ